MTGTATRSRGTDVAIVGTGPNGLAAAVTLARAGLGVRLHEAAETPGGGLRTQPLFDSEVRHDICSAVHPMAAASPFFRAFDLAGRGVDLLRTDISYAHPLDHGRAALAHHDLEATCAGLGADGATWRRLMRPLLEHSDGVVDFLLSGQRSVPRDLAAPLLLATRILRHGTSLATRAFAGEEAPALLSGVAAHAVGSMPSLPSAAIATLLGHLAHGPGWPLPRGGSAALAHAMLDDAENHGATVHTGEPITDLRDVLPARAVLLDTSPTGFLQLAGDLLPPSYARALARYRYGPGAAKADFLVSEPIPWTNPAVGRAGTVHIGGTRRALSRQETRVSRGLPTDEPFVLLVDPAVTDPSRASDGKRPVWAYAHVPHGDNTDPTELLQRRIERYAPGFRDTVIAVRGTSAAAWEQYNPNYVGGDIGAGAVTLTQTLLRPTPRIDPHHTPLPGVYLCSASTPPGPGVHGMSGYLAARSALRREFGIHTVPSLRPAGTGRSGQRAAPT